MTHEADATKGKILEQATELFAQKGFDGTSVREIAKAADVNLASINYHFKSKENLYWSIYEYSYQTLEEKIMKVVEDSNDFEESIWQIFCMMTAKGSLMKNTFIIFLSDFTSKISSPKDKLLKTCGPPGATYIAKLVTEVVNDDKFSKEALEWAVHTIFANVAHAALVSTTDYYKKMVEEAEDHGVLLHQEKSIKLHARAIIYFLKDHPQDFQ